MTYDSNLEFEIASFLYFINEISKLAQPATAPTSHALVDEDLQYKALLKRMARTQPVYPQKIVITPRA
jgi:hypothetical protein